MRVTRGPFQSLTRTCAGIPNQELIRNVTRILLTNDDGASHSLTLARPLRIRQIDDRHWTVDGTPTDCVTLALNKILQESELPHVCASGINHGGNLGDDATYSGTVAGALEATILGVPGIAVSLVAREHFEFAEAANFGLLAVRKILSEGLPEGTLLNINAGP